MMTRPPGLSTRATSASARSGSGTWCSTSINVAGIEPRIVDRQRFEVAAAQIDVVEPREALLRRLQHGRRCVDRDDPGDEGREHGAQLAGAAAKIADDPVRVGQRRERRQVKAIAEQLVAQSIPLAGRRGEEFLRRRASLGERAWSRR